MSTQENGDRKEQIFVGAEKVFSERGYSSATIEEIAYNAGVAKGTVYLYFTSKQDLFVSLVEEKVGSWAKTLEGKLAAATNIDDLLEVVIRSRLDFFADHLGLIHTLAHSMVSLPKDKQMRIMKIRCVIDDLFARNLTRVTNNFTPEEATRYAIFIYGAVDSIIGYLTQKQEKIDPSVLTAELKNWVCYGIK